MQLTDNMQHGRFILVDCEDAEKWQGYLVKLWSNVLSQPAESMQRFSAPHGEFPSIEQVKACQLIVIGGSHYSAYEDLPWINDFLQLLPQWVEAGVRIVACCFGHQLIARALGGSVGKNPSGKFVLGIEEIQCKTTALQQVGLLELLQAALPQTTESGVSTSPANGETETEETLTMCQLESHGDCVPQLPPGAILLAHSGSCSHEMWSLGNNVLAFQFHPELTPALALEKILPAAAQKGTLNLEEAQQAETRFKRVTPHASAMHAVIRHFADNGLKHVPAAETDTGIQGGVTNLEKKLEDLNVHPTAAERTSDSLKLENQHAQHGSNGSKQGVEEVLPSRLRSPHADKAEDAMVKLIENARAVFDKGLQGTCIDVEQLTGMNQIAVNSCAAAADKATELSINAKEQQVTALSVQKSLDTLQQLESLLDGMNKMVDNLDEQTRMLARHVNVPEKSTLWG